MGERHGANEEQHHAGAIDPVLVRLRAASSGGVRGGATRGPGSTVPPPPGPQARRLRGPWRSRPSSKSSGRSSCSRGLDGRVGDPPDRRAARQNHQLGALICASWPAAPAPPAPPPTPRSRGTVDGRDGVSCRMQRIPEAGLTRLTRAASLLLLLPLLLVLAAGHLPGGSASARGGTSSDQAQVSWPVGVGNYGWIGALPAGAAGTRPAVPPGARAAATSRAQAPAPSSPAAVTSGRTDRTAARARPVLAWAPEVVLLAGPPLLPGQLPRPPSAVDPRTDPGPSRGRAPPGSAGT